MEGPTADGGQDPVAFWHAFAPAIETSASLEEAAGEFCARMYDACAAFAVLVRVFATVPYGRLDTGARRAADAFAAMDRAGGIDPSTPVLALLGTSGVEPDWRRRESSRDHGAIPLLSEEYVDGIPMVARLLGEIGFAAPVSRGDAWQFVSRDGADGSGLFFVGDARTATDDRGRPIIPAVGFVERYGVKSVFGFGGPTGGTDHVLTAIVFTRRTLLRADAMRYAPLLARFRSATAPLIAAGRVFRQPEP